MSYVKTNCNSPRQQAKRRGIRCFYMSESAPRGANGKPIPFRKKDFSYEVLEQHNARE